MPESTSRLHCTIDAIRPRVDFACHWRLALTTWYVYRVPSHQLLLVESGILRARTPRGEVRAGPGELLWLTREARTEYGFSGSVSYWEAHVSFAALGQPELPLWLEGAPVPDVVPLGAQAEAARRLFGILCLELDRPGEAPRLRVRGAAFELLATVAAALGREPRGAARPDPWQRLRARLGDELADHLTLSELAADMDISEDHLIRGFRKRFGVSPMAYRAQARLRWAATVLAADNQSVKEVAHRLGFRDASAFSRAFRRQFGLAPTELRVAGPESVPPPVTGSGDEPYALNRHIRPPGSAGAWFDWG